MVQTCVFRTEAALNLLSKRMTALLSIFSLLFARFCGRITGSSMQNQALRESVAKTLFFGNRSKMQSSLCPELLKDFEDCDRVSERRRIGERVPF